MNTLKFKVAAKTDVGLVRTNNEDNFQVASDLSSGQMRWVNNEICSLGEKGALLVVADGMGGMNAGEVASELAIETVREYFALENLTLEVTKNRFSIEKYMNDVVVAADARIKREARNNPEAKGMGTTIVIAWILDGKLYVSWCGDSRAYIYNPEAGLHQITKDHSYVQSLVDKGALSREEAFDFPDSNIITRSLSDGTAKAKPESLMKPYELCNNDIVLLCTDGLNGMIRDAEIEAVIRNNEHDLSLLVDDLIQAACDAEGSDNVTICLCKVLQGGGVCDPSAFDETERRLNGGGKSNNIVRTLINGGDGEEEDKKKRWPLILVLCIVVVLGLAGLGWWYFSRPEPKPNPQEEVTEEMEKPKEGSEPQTSEEEPRKPIVPQKVEKPIAKPEDKEGIKPGASISGSILAPKEPEEKKEEDDDVLSPQGKLPIGDEQEEVKEPEKTPDEVGEEKPKEEELTPVTPKDSVKTKEYKVKKGETYYGLAKRFNTTSEELKKLNKGKELKVGETILVPTN